MILFSWGTIIDYKIITGILVLILLITGSALMSGSEVAFFSLRPEDLEKLKDKKTRKTQILLKLYENPEKLLSTIVVANNASNISAVILAAFLISGFFNDGTILSGFIIKAVLIIFLLLFFSEILPKVYASRRKMELVMFMSYPLFFLEKILRPVTFLLLTSSSFFRKRAAKSISTFSINDISNALDRDSDNLKEDEKILKGIVNFGNTNVSAIMIPRIDVTTIDIKSGFKSVISLIINSGFSRIPVYHESFDNVKGVLYAKDVLPFMTNADNFKWQVLLRQPYFVPETKKINDLLKEFQIKKIHMAMVIDEYGGTSGIVTLEDILEEIVGEITDESDEDEVMYRKIDERTFIFEGKILLDDFCKILDVEESLFLEVRGESETLAGLILELTGEIPRKDHAINFKFFRFRIESVDKRRIKEIRVDINKEEGEAK